MRARELGPGGLGQLMRLLCGADRLRLTAAAALHLLARLFVVFAAVVLGSGTRAEGVRALFVVAAVLLVQRGVTALYRIETQARVLSALTAALLADRNGLADTVSPDAELALVEGMYAAERVVGQRAPELGGDVPACVLLALFVAMHEPSGFVVAGGAAALGGGLAVLLVRSVSATQAERVWRAFLPALDDLLAAIHGRLEVIGNGVQPRLLEALARKLELWAQASRAAGAVSLVAGRAPAAAAIAVGGGVLLARGAWGDASLASAAVLASVVPAFAGLARSAIDLRRDLVRARPVLDCLAAANVARGAPRADRALPEGPRVVRWTGVSFVYPGEASPSLADVSATWSSGELLAFAGPNGSGKSTLCRLLLGLHEPSEGTISFGGSPLRDLDQARLRASVAYLAQRPYLPDRATVRQAVHLLAPDATDGTIEEALARLGLWPVLARRAGRPLEVAVGTLSAGERQRLALARVLLRDAAMLVLDEPDANLDADGLVVIARVLRDELRTRMVLVIAHSPALLAHADRVVRLDRGRVVPS